MKSHLRSLKNRVRRVAKFAWIYSLYASGALAICKMWARRSGAILVLTLHRVLDNEEYEKTSSLPGMVIRLQTFAALMRHLAHYAEPVDLNRTNLFDIYRARQPVVITFDDGWRDTGTIAFPVATCGGFPITVFVCPGLAGHIAPFWPERYVAMRRRVGVRPDANEVEALKHASGDRREHIFATLRISRADEEAQFVAREPNAMTMSWEQLRRLAAAGACIGSHTHTHQILTTISLGAADEEIGRSKQEILAEMGKCHVFAYPNGNYSEDVVNVVQHHGYQFAFTTQTGWWRRKSDRFKIPRINISENKVTGPSGRFSRAVFEYFCFWKPILNRAETCGVSASQAE